jgi:hypothetical protein
VPEIRADVAAQLRSVPDGADVAAQLVTTMALRA